MVVAFSLVALAMVLGGLAAIAQGGLIGIGFSLGGTWVTVGAISATGGVLLAAAAALIGRLARIERALERRSANGEPDDTPVPPASAPPPRGTGETGAERRPVPARTEPVLDLPTPPAQPSPAQAAPVQVAPAQAIPLQDASLFRAEGEADGPAAPPKALRGTLDAPEPRPTPPAAPTVAGTYSSGGNTYVMYSDGSIQAETPDGRFRFDTLDELKAFIAAGGERKR